ncbi:helix-turn-helix transcriptional regulator [Variovorax sp. M-6]|uniref:helix-turn-helix transcriptional regulator n=1 Tax=Variovorax sp. M-6 TaxID=3233041 RepID=UPI003F9BEBED
MKEKKQQPASVAVDRLVRLPEVKHLTGLGRSSIYSYLQAGAFPQAVRVGERAVAWRLSDLERWMAGRPSTAQAEAPQMPRTVRKASATKTPRASSSQAAHRKVIDTTAKRPAPNPRKAHA